MKTLLGQILSVLVTAQFALGSFANGFIILVNCPDWIKKRKISLVDQIVTVLAISRIGFLWVALIVWYTAEYNSALNGITVFRITINITWTVSSHFTSWLATSLSILYLLKIANFSSLLFLYLKWRVKCVLLVILLGSLIFLVFQLIAISMYENVVSNEKEENMTWKTKPRYFVQVSNFTIYLVSILIPFIMSLISLVLLIFSLWKHLKKMQLSGKGSQDHSTKVHIRALQTVVSFLFLFAIYFFDTIISLWNFDKMLNKLILMFCNALVILYPSSHSFILIWGNKKLTQAFLSFLWQLKFQLRERSKLGVVSL
ncbi:taste receptor type 2 member 46-like [Suncus etruscus]|uniref:taste receptor type 2 member 46-like n=1 Tax=Suncus etruscus TaxID=109475 RepID=UPI00210F81A2|nr:taste receptor type 2 member 46-like [Suncus etruscus]